VVDRFIDGMPRKYEVATDDVRLSAALVEIEPGMACATAIELVTARK